jgi:hypothetical protein
MTTISRTKTAKNTVHPNQEQTTMKKTAKKPTHASTTPTTATSADAPAAAVTASPAVTPTPPPTAGPTGTSSNAIAIQLQALEQTCGYGDPLADASRATYEKLVQRVPSAIIDRVITLAVRGGGTIAGIAFDPNAAKANLADADEADAVATAALMLARRAQDHAIRLRSRVSGDASAIKTALRGFVKTAQGAPLAQESDELRAITKQHKAAAKARHTRAKNAAAAAASPPVPVETPAPVATPEPTPTPPTPPKAS